MRCVRICLLTFQAVLLAGCFPTIYSREPLGVIQRLDPLAWDAPWSGQPFFASRNIVRIRVVDGDRGVIGLWERCPDDPESVEYLQIRSLPAAKESGLQWLVLVPQRLDSEGGFVPLSVPSTEDPPYAYAVFSVRPEHDLWIWYLVAVDRVVSLIEKGVLPGQVERGKAILGHLESEHYKALMSLDRPVVHWEAPLVYVRMPPEYDPCRKQEPAK
jgi:hypothetical protein